MVDNCHNVFRASWKGFLVVYVLLLDGESDGGRKSYRQTIKVCNPSSFALFGDQICHKFGAFLLDDWKRILLEHAQSVFLPIDILLGLAAPGF